MDACDWIDSTKRRKLGRLWHIERKSRVKDQLNEHSFSVIFTSAPDIKVCVYYLSKRVQGGRSMTVLSLLRFQRKKKGKLFRNEFVAACRGDEETETTGVVGLGKSTVFFVGVVCLGSV